MEVLLMAVLAASNIACFLIGAKVGQKVSKDEEIMMEMPKLDYAKQKSRKEAEWEQNRIDTILRNVEAYDGTSYGQEDVPRG